MSNHKPVKPFEYKNKPVFDAPWHAQVLALAEALINAGQFSPDQWAQALGAERRAAAATQAPDTAETYYKNALSALEKLLSTTSVIKISDVTARRDAWARAYGATPHGKPVLLGAGT